MVTWGIQNGLLAKLFVFLAVAVTAVIAGRSLRFTTWKDILPHSLGFVVMMGLQDALFVVSVHGWNIYSDLSLWIVYAIVACAPLLAPKLRPHKEAPPVF
jgi:hypothetical protein